MGTGTVFRALTLTVLTPFLAGAAISDEVPQPLPEEPLPIGTAAPLFTVTTFEGNEIALESWRDHVVVLNYFITWYRDAARHLDVMERIATKFSADGLRVLSISLDEGQGGPEATRSFISDHNTAHPVAADPDQAVAGRYGVRALPAIFVIDTQGKIARYHEGYMDGDDARIEGMISEVLSGGTDEAQVAAAEATAPGETEEPVCKCFKEKD